MSRRQKIIMLTVGLYVAGFVVYLSVNSLWLAPARKLSKSIAEKRTELFGQETQISSIDRHRRRLRELVASALGTEQTVVRERVRERLMELLRRSGLGSSGLSVDLFDGVRRDAYREVGAMVRASGPLEKVVDFLHLLRADPVLHRVENLSITPTRQAGRVDLKFRYATVVPSASAVGEVPTTQPVASPPASPERRREWFDALVQRDMFRPYIKRPQRYRPDPRPQPQPSTQPSSQPSRLSSPPPPPEEGFRVVGLPTLGGKVQIHLRDPRRGDVRTYEVGDHLGQATIAAVDYRRIRRDDDYSTSRLVLLERGVYWAVELGETIREKRRLATYELPPELGTQPTSEPATDADESEGKRVKP